MSEYFIVRFYGRQSLKARLKSLPRNYNNGRSCGWGRLKSCWRMVAVSMRGGLIFRPRGSSVYLMDNLGVNLTVHFKRGYLMQDE